MGPDDRIEVRIEHLDGGETLVLQSPEAMAPIEGRRQAVLEEEQKLNP